MRRLEKRVKQTDGMRKKVRICEEKKESEEE